MQKQVYFFTGILALIFFFANAAQAQPEGYYETAEGLAGEDLKTALHHIINDHNEFSYTSSATDVWDILKETDRDPENADNVIMIYTGRSIDAVQEYNSGNGWTREHIWPQSRGDFGTSQGAGTDAHHIRPLENSVNSTRSNRSFANCNSCVEVVFQGESTGSFYDDSNYSFEPRDEVKGDVARMIFYMALRYEGTNGELDLELANTLFDQGDNAPLHGKLDDLLEWNDSDPVDEFEANRNDVIHYQFQGNRNPFIDHPELARFIWGESEGELWGGEVVSTLHLENRESGKLFPNPVDYQMRYTETYSRMEIFNQTGQIIGEHPHRESIDLSYLDSGVYYCRVYAADGTFSMHRIVKL
ncbi:MAG: endonuclease [Cryomorphaceae bacterium]|nr:endonuclease [Flavobacteriales bacterium]